MKKWFSTLMLVLCVSACGGSGGSSSTGGNGDNNGSGTTGGSNNAPTVSLATDAIELLAGDSTRVAITLEDEDGDALTVSLASSDPVVSALHQEGELIISAKAVAEQLEAIVTVTVSDGALQAQAQLAVTVLPFQTLSARMVGETHLQIFRGSQGVFQFELEAGTVPKEQLQFDLTFETYGAPSSVPYELDLTNQTITIRPDFSINDQHTAILGISDGVSRVELPFSFHAVVSTGSAPILDLPLITFLSPGQEKVFDYASGLSANEAALKVVSVETRIGSDAGLMVSFDNDARQLRFSASADAQPEMLQLAIQSEDLSSVVYTGFYQVVIKAAQSAQESALEEQLHQTWLSLAQGMEYDRLAFWLIDLLELRGEFSRDEARSHRNRIKDTHFVVYSYHAEALACVQQALEQGLPPYTRQWGAQTCFAGERSTADESTGQMSNHYADSHNLAQAQAGLEQIAQAYLDLGQMEGKDTADLTNELIALAKAHVPELAIAPLGTHYQLNTLSDGRRSRFAGNALYGEQVDGQWQYHAEWALLEVITDLVNEGYHGTF
ncbi:Ig-like domain-containing protein [Ferrimonas marina]|uniref:Ig-like domain (Group 2) n=1 Tax=Ferrimonas marina TaxID=299255 RepID=A0A1M5RYR4_9GAMM|nr:hypothetical protein [Ferrimonas marina]SHH31386.1 hypothetical protein SAMN02745129_1805 [Ferrimonas marina]